jgi:UPF0716 protein FxsA
MRRPWLLLIVIGFPLVELALLLWLAEKLSWFWVLAWVIGTGVAGLALVRRTGLRCYEDVQRQLQQGQWPGDRIFDALLLLIAGALLFLPGVLTDLAGLFLCLPPARGWIRRRVYRRLAARLRSGSAAVAGEAPRHDRIIDVRVIEKEKGP